MEICLNGNAVSPKERNTLIRYCLSVATRAKCSTRALLRPFKKSDLKAAFAEQQRVHAEEIAGYERSMEEYNPKTTELPSFLYYYLGGKPSKEEYAEYCRTMIRQEREVLRTLKRSYSIRVDYDLVGRKLLAFHRSLNPRVTFGYSSELHEECDFPLDEEKRTAFMQSSLAELPRWKGDWIHDWGNVLFGDMRLFYEDLALYRGETPMLETTSHEQMMTVWLEEDDLLSLGREKGGKALLRKLHACESKE